MLTVAEHRGRLLAIFDAFLGVVQRYFTSRVGEGLIYDLRTQVFGHVQRQPIAFFTRAQTGSLVSRLPTATSSGRSRP